MVQRLTYRRHNHYNTKSNKVRVVKLPGGKNIFHHIQKRPGRPKCGDCKRPLDGVSALRPSKYGNIPKRDRRVSRAYGGSRCHKCVRDRVVRAFLLEEQKCVQAVLLEKEKQRGADPSTKKSSKSSSKKSSKKH